jgi:hypothetical protein
MACPKSIKFYHFWVEMFVFHKSPCYTEDANNYCYPLDWVSTTIVYLVIFENIKNKKCQHSLSAMFAWPIYTKTLGSCYNIENERKYYFDIT